MFPSFWLAVEVVWLDSMMRTLTLNGLTEKWAACNSLKHLVIKKWNKPQGLTALVYFSIHMNEILNLYPKKTLRILTKQQLHADYHIVLQQLMATYQNHITGFLDSDYHVLVKTISTRVR